MSAVKVEKYSVPTKFTQKPHGTICKVMKDNEEFDFYIQVSHDINFPKWEKFGTILEKAFENSIDNEEFIKICLNLYETGEKVSKEILGKIPS